MTNKIWTTQRKEDGIAVFNFIAELFDVSTIWLEFHTEPLYQKRNCHNLLSWLVLMNSGGVEWEDCVKRVVQYIKETTNKEVVEK